MNTKWTLPEDAILTVREMEAVGDHAQERMNRDWNELGFSGSPPAMSNAVVRYVFEGIRVALEPQARLTPAAPDRATAHRKHESWLLKLARKFYIRRFD